jgi:acyl-CoA thioester hydrolase
MPMPHQLPSAEQVDLLPDALVGVVTDEFIDMNGHMNVLYYLDWGARGAEALVERAGIDDAYRAARRMGLFTVEHHLAYFSEMRNAATFSVHTRVLDRSDKVLHLMTFLLDRSANRWPTRSRFCWSTSICRRGALRLPTDIAAAFDAHIAHSKSMGWSAPVCGAIAIRRQV